MENNEIARRLHEIADLLEIKGANPFRIRSYRNAALVVEGYPESFKRLLEKGPDALKGIPGIGESIREKIVEMLATGKCSFHETLVKELPEGILDILKIQGVGPKKTSEFYRLLGIGSVAELERAAAAGRIRELPGMGEKSEAKLLNAIKALKSLAGRFNLAAAWAEAAELVEFISGLAGVEDVAVAGSLRRWQESIGDIDILAASEHSTPIMRAFTTRSDVEEVLMEGQTRSTVLLKSGFHVDLRVVKKSSFGAAWQYFTGSKAHNVALRERARKMGLKINEYGVFDKTGFSIAGATEEDVYSAVGLPWIPPEIRDNSGEIEAAVEGRLPKLLEVTDIRGDLHSHSRRSDGSATIDEMARAAMERGYEYLAVTDHSKALGVANGLDTRRVRAEMEAIDSFNEAMQMGGNPFRLLKGTEVDIRADGTLDHPHELLEELDCVVAAVHSGFSMDSAAMTERIIKAIQTGRVDILAHPTGRLISSRSAYAVDMEAVMDAALEFNVAMELNSCPERLDLKDSHLRLAVKKGLKICISTDSHSTGQLSNIVFGLHTARRGWLEPENVLNTMGLKELSAYIASRLSSATLKKREE